MTHDSREPRQLLLWLSLIALIFVSITVMARGEERLSEISPKLAAYCALYSREMTLINILHPTKAIDADTDVILEIAKGHYGDCLSVLPTLLPMPANLGDLKSWLADMRDVVLLRSRSLGTEPAVEEKVVEGDEEWRAQCRAEYNSWEEETGTVVRRGSPQRVRCPCGGEVRCGE